VNTLEAIAGRRSIRRFEARSLERRLVERILEATVQAPSAKNAQPWRFVVLEGDIKDELVGIMEAEGRRLKEAGMDIGSLEGTARAMRMAPVAVVVLNAPIPQGIPETAREAYRFVMDQSTGGAIQTMLLAAHELGVGSLWICDIFYAYDEVLKWLGREDHRLVAAVSLGYAAESPGPRPRRPWQELTEWRGGG